MRTVLDAILTHAPEWFIVLSFVIGAAIIYAVGTIFAVIALLWTISQFLEIAGEVYIRAERRKLGKGYKPCGCGVGPEFCHPDCPHREHM